MPAFCNPALVIPGPVTSTTLEHLHVLLFSSYSVIPYLEGKNSNCLCSDSGYLTGCGGVCVALHLDSIISKFYMLVTDEIDVKDKNQKLNFIQINIGVRNNFLFPSFSLS